MEVSACPSAVSQSPCPGTPGDATRRHGRHPAGPRRPFSYRYTTSRDLTDRRFDPWSNFVSEHACCLDRRDVRPRAEAATGGELTRFSRCRLWGPTCFRCVARRRSGMSRRDLIGAWHHPQASYVPRASISVEVKGTKGHDRARCGHAQEFTHHRGGRRENGRAARRPDRRCRCSRLCGGG